MKFSERWLREWVNPAIDTDALVAQLTMAGLEVDAVEPVAGDFSQVVVGEISDCQPHPDADKLKVCQVLGHPDGPLQVVCGAPNARPGIKVPFALVGAALPGDLTIKAAKLRGVASNGMLCAAEELGLGESDGLLELPADAPVGTDLRDYLELDDRAIEVDLTPNRADCLGIAGLAREVGVLNRVPVTAPVIDPVPASHQQTRPVSLVAPEACPRYIGRVVSNVDLNRSSPLWLQEKLRRCGLRPIDPVVDVTNYVLLELGQPLHAFDLDRLDGGIQVRWAKAGEPLTLLDGQAVELTDTTLVIADDSKPLAMAGIMGGADSAVGEGTRNVFLESAFFAPTAIAGRAREYGLHTDASHRFERGVDYRLQELAIERATALLLAITGGEAGPLIVADSTGHVPSEPVINLDRARIGQYLGVDLSAAEVSDILERLGLAKVHQSDDAWQWRAPSWRFDLAIEVDLLEELARIYGYNNLPTRTPAVVLPLAPRTESRLSVAALRAPLLDRGYQEAITYSFVPPAWNSQLDPHSQPVPLANPISSDMAVMRTSLWPGLLQALRHNRHRQQERIRLFEVGLCFRPGKDGLRQEAYLAGVIAGRRQAESWWADNSAKVDFYDLKGDVEALLSLGGGADQFVPAQHPALHPGQCARVERDGERLGYLGQLHPLAARELDIDVPVYLFELALGPLRQARLPAASGLSKYPEVRRDLAVVVDKKLNVDELLATARGMAGDYLRELKVFDVYVGEGIENTRKSVALGLTFQHPSRTLNEDEVNAAVAAVVRELEQRFNASLR